MDFNKMSLHISNSHTPHKEVIPDSTNKRIYFRWRKSSVEIMCFQRIMEIVLLRNFSTLKMENH